MTALANRVRPDLPGRFNEAELLLRQWPRINALLQGTILPPYEVLIHPSSTCNLTCEWCIGDYVPTVDPVSNRTIVAHKTAAERLPDTLADPHSMDRVVRGIVGYRKRVKIELGGHVEEHEFRTEAVSFSGLIGEPLLSRKAVLRAMGLLVEHDIRVGMFTNGVLMDASTWDVLVRTGYVLVSIDAGTARTYGRLKHRYCGAGESAFNRAMRNLEGLVRRREDTGNSVDINAAFILYPHNYHEVYEAAARLKEIGVDCLRIKQDISGNRRLSTAQVTEALALLDRIDADLVDDGFRLIRIHRLMDPDEGRRTFSRCLITDMMAAVGSDGNLYPCNYHPRPGGVVYGSAIDHPFRDVWEGARRAQLKAGIPKVCPAVCDPFKNRANQLLNAVVEVQEALGHAELERERTSVLARLI